MYGISVYPKPRQLQPDETWPQGTPRFLSKSPDGSTIGLHIGYCEPALATFDATKIRITVGGSCGNAAQNVELVGDGACLAPLGDQMDEKWRHAEARK